MVGTEFGEQAAYRIYPTSSGLVPLKRNVNYVWDSK